MTSSPFFRISETGIWRALPPLGMTEDWMDTRGETAVMLAILNSPEKRGAMRGVMTIDSKVPSIPSGYENSPCRTTKEGRGRRVNSRSRYWNRQPVHCCTPERIPSLTNWIRSALGRRAMETAKKQEDSHADGDPQDDFGGSLHSVITPGSRYRLPRGRKFAGTGVHGNRPPALAVATAPTGVGNDVRGE